MKKSYEPCKRSFEDLRGRHRFGGSDADIEMLVKIIGCESVDLAHLSKKGSTGRAQST